MKKYAAVFKDGFLLLVVSTVFVVAVSTAFKGLKKSAPMDPLVTAITQENTDSVKDELKGADAKDRANKADNLGRTPLMWAAYANFSDKKQTDEADGKRLPLVDLLLTSGADIQAQDQDGWTALTWAAWSGLTGVADKLLAQGASAALTDRQGNTPLMIAAQRGNAEIVRLLLAKGADVKVARKDGKSLRDLLEEARRAYPKREARYQEIVSSLGNT